MSIILLTTSQKAVSHPKIPISSRRMKRKTAEISKRTQKMVRLNLINAVDKLSSLFYVCGAEQSVHDAGV